MAPIGKAQWQQLCRCESWSGAALTENARATAARDRARPLSRGTVHRRGLELGESGRTISLEAPGANVNKSRRLWSKHSRAGMRHRLFHKGTRAHRSERYRDRYFAGITRRGAP